jgi:hypothetical protein
MGVFYLIRDCFLESYLISFTRHRTEETTMQYPPVKQFETLALEAELRTRLARERQAARAWKRAPGRRRFLKWLPLLRPEPRTAERAPCRPV